MRQIYPAIGEPIDVAALAAAYAYPDVSGKGAWLRANMVTSLDGATQGPNGRSATVSSPPDRILLGLLRALADVVLVGAGTARVERYGPAERQPAFADLRRTAGQPPTPPIALVSRSLDLDPSSPLFTSAPQQTIVLTVDTAPADRRTALASVADVVTVGQVSIDVDAATQALVERGLPRILCEGGPHVLAYFVEADRLDELCYTITPTMVGGRSARLMETPQSLTSRWQLAHIVEDDGTLLTRWIRAASPTSSSAT